MTTVTGTFRGGVVLPDVPVDIEDGRAVLLTIADLPPGADLPSAAVDASDALGLLIDACKGPTGIPDLAHEHDHYLHGTPKRG